MPQPRVPAHLRKLRATYRARKASATGADGDELRTAPHFLNPRARAIYKSAIAAAAAGQLRKVDRDLVASWALIVDQQREAARALEEVSAPDQSLVLQRIIRDCAKTLVSLSDRLCFNPAVRSRTKTDELPPKKDAGEFDPWLALRLVPGGGRDDQC